MHFAFAPLKIIAHMAIASIPPLTAPLIVAAGGALGAAARYEAGRLVTHLIGPTADFPWATMTVNILGSLLMGLLVGWLALGGSDAKMAYRLFIGVGLLGGFTTFSAFSMEIILMIERGSYLPALSYAGLSVVAGLTAMMIGLAIMRAAL